MLESHVSRLKISMSVVPADDSVAPPTPLPPQHLPPTAAAERPRVLVNDQRQGNMAPAGKKKGKEPAKEEEPEEESDEESTDDESEEEEDLDGSTDDESEEEIMVDFEFQDPQKSISTG